MSTSTKALASLALVAVVSAIEEGSVKLCVDCAHHRNGWFGRHICGGYVSHSRVTGKDTMIEDTCESMRATHYTSGYGIVRSMSALCGPEGRLFEPERLSVD